MAPIDLRTGGVGVDTREFASFAKALRKAKPVLAKELAKSLRAAGEIVAVEARANATSEGSTSIPPTVKTRVASATVSVVAGGAKSPIAGLWELGNSGRASQQQIPIRGGGFRHPVFGNRNVWVNQPRHPFLLRALHAKAFVAEKAALDALDAAVATVVSSTGV